MGTVAISFQIEYQLLDQFKIALSLNKEDKDKALDTMMKKYVSDTFINIGKSIYKESEPIAHSIKYNTINEPIAKKRIPLWAHKPYQINHKIIKAFLQVQNENGKVSLEELARRCNEKYNYPETYVEKFYGNFVQMKTDEGHPHGKVFVDKDGIIEVWEEVRDVFNMYKKYFQ